MSVESIQKDVEQLRKYFDLLEIEHKQDLASKDREIERLKKENEQLREELKRTDKALKYLMNPSIECAELRRIEK